MNLLFKIHLQNERNGHACTDFSDCSVDRRNNLLFDYIALLATELIPLDKQDSINGFRGTGPASGGATCC